MPPTTITDGVTVLGVAGNRLVTTLGVVSFSGGGCLTA
jgi:hypothetical protein